MVALCALLTGNAHGQEDLTLPPRIIDTHAAGPAAPSRLATMPDEEREEVLEEIIVVRENPWRLPDLGSEWRAREEAEPSTGRIEVDLLPLYDPAAEEPMRNPFPLNREQARVGFIEVFRIRFGRR